MSPLVNTLGGHNDQAKIRKAKVKGGEAITAGQVVKISQTADDGYTVLVCGSGEIPCGVALEAIASGGYGWIQTGGISKVALTTDENVAANSGLLTGASGAVAHDVIDASAVGPLLVGYALHADSSTTLAAGDAIICPWAGSWLG